MFAMLIAAGAAGAWMYLDQDRKIARAHGFDVGSCRDLARTFSRKPTQQAIVEFSSKDLAAQYVVYICGSQYMEPPTMYLAEPFAAEGGAAAIFLKGKLSEATDDVTIRDIVLVFVEIQRQLSYNFASDANLVSLIRLKAESVSDRSWREFLAKEIAEVE